MMRALVTGGNGFVGRALVDQLLARGDEVRVLGRRPYPALEALGVACVVADLGAQDDCDSAVQGCDVVFHVAAQAGMWGDWGDYYRNNVVATQHILRTAVRVGVPKFVYTSSPSVVMGGSDLCGVDERQPYARHYLAPYPHTKALAEQHVLAERNMLTVAIRPHLVWGPGDPHILPRLLERARAGRLPQIGDGTNKVDITYVDNAAQAHVLAADALHEHSPVRGRAYFIGQERPVVLWDFVGQLLRSRGAPPVKLYLSATTARRLATVIEGGYRLFGLRAEPPLTRLVASEMAHSHWFDLSAARRDLGYHPRISIEEGLRRVAASWSA